MTNRCGTLWALLALAAASGLGACFGGNEEADPPWDEPGGGGPTTTGTIGPGGGAPTVPECPPGETCHSQSAATDGVGGTGGATAAGGGHATPFVIPAECDHLDPRFDLLLYLPTDDSNSMASPALAREQLEAGLAPTHVRPHEFLNYYRFDPLYPAPTTEEHLAAFARGALRSDGITYDVQIAVRSADPAVPRGSMTITFVLDNSGSMLGEAMTRQRAVVAAVAQSLQTGDRVNLVTWDTADAVRLDGHAVAGPGDATLVSTADALAGDGGTDLHGGLVAGYALAEQHYQTGGLNRVILVSDGATNIGVTEETLIRDLTADGEREGIYLVGVGSGPADGYGDPLMDRVTDRGRGAYVYVDSADEATELFVERFDEVMDVAARAVRVEVTLPWYFEPNEQSGPEVATTQAQAEAEADPQHLAPGDTMLFHQVFSGCHPDAVALNLPILITVSWETPGSHDPMQRDFWTSIGELTGHDPAPLRKAQAIMAYAEALETGTDTMLDLALSMVLEANAGFDDPDLVEIAQLIQRHPAYLP